MRYRPVHVISSSSVSSQQNKPTILRSVCTGAVLALLLASGAPRAEANGQLALTPGSADFGSVRIGRTKSVSVTMTNSGNATVTVSGDTLTGSGYRVTGITMPLNLRAGATLTFKVCFSPTSAGNSSGQLTFISDASNSTAGLPLTGTGVWKNTTTSGSGGTGYVSATPQTAQFGNVPLGTSNTQAIQLTNTGSAGISISGVTATGSGFSVAGIATPFSLAAGATTQLTVGFLPTVTGSVSGSVGITSTASDSQLSIAVSGTGVSVTKVLAASPSSVAFGNVDVNATATQPITLTNSGNSNLTISGDAISGAGISATGLSGGVTLAPGQSTAMSASFTPKSTGGVTGAITIASDATNTANLSVPVTGTGVSTTSHNVELQWQASTSSGVSGYYVYRGTNTGGPYSRLNGTTTTATNYSDSAMNSGTTYYYVVTSVGSDGLESGYSNQVTAVIP